MSSFVTPPRVSPGDNHESVRFSSFEAGLRQEGRRIFVTLRPEDVQRRLEFFREKNLLLPTLDDTEARQDSGLGIIQRRERETWLGRTESSQPRESPNMTPTSLAKEMDEEEANSFDQSDTERQEDRKREFYFDPSERAEHYRMLETFSGLGSPIPQHTRQDPHQWRQQLKRRSNKNALGTDIDSKSNNESPLMLVARGA